MKHLEMHARNEVGLLKCLFNREITVYISPSNSCSYGFELSRLTLLINQYRENMALVEPNFADTINVIHFNN